MFMINKLRQSIFGQEQKEHLVELPEGQLYIVRPDSPKGYSELIYTDARAFIRKTDREFQYELVVQRAIEEGEEGLEDEDLEGLDQDEKTFLLDEALKFRRGKRESGEYVFAWRDMLGDSDDVYELICAAKFADQANDFTLAAKECQYERKFRKPASDATMTDLNRFSFEDDEPIPNATQPTSVRGSASVNLLAKDVNKPKTVKQDIRQPQPIKDTPRIPEDTETKSLIRSAPKATDVLTTQRAELHLFDPVAGDFKLQHALVIARVLETGDWTYWITISDLDGNEIVVQEVIADISPVFNFEYLSNIFNVYLEDGSVYSYLVRFSSQSILQSWQEAVMTALWQQLHHIKFSKIDDAEREYVLESLNDLTMKDTEEEEEEDEEEEPAPTETGRRAEHYDEDESEDDVEVQPQDGQVNSSLAVGTSGQRSYVIRGDNIGVFKHNPENHALEFTTNISSIKMPGKEAKALSPTKVMLHENDRNMIMQSSSNPSSLYNMDLEYGRVVEEYKIGEPDTPMPVEGFTPDNKFAQRTDNPTFVGYSKNALFRIDPRQQNQKLNLDELKQYATKQQFSAAGTTGQGYIAVATEKGEIKLFDSIGKNAKTSLPPLSQGIIALDTSADGRYVLATCRTCLLLVDTLQKDGKYEGKLGFERSFAKDKKPQAIRLQISPQHEGQFRYETKQGVNFTKATFNTSPDGKETSIITATGPYLVTWSLRKVLAHKENAYQIKRYADTVIADQFEYGSDENVLLALPNEVDMVSRKAFKKPTRESIAGIPSSSRVSLSANAYNTPRKTRGSYLRNEIVNSPY